MRGVRRRSIYPALLALALVAVATPSFAGEGREPVRTSSGWEFQPAVGNDGISEYISWSQNSRRRPRHWTEYVNVDGGAPRRVNAGDTNGFGGGMDGSMLVFQEIDRNFNSDLRLYDVATDSFTGLPNVLVNRYWQWAPSIDGEWILYGENRFARPDSPWRIYLYNLTTGEKRLLDESTFRCGCIFPGQVQGNYATWTKCGGKNCDVFLHDIGSNQTAIVANPAARQQYYGGVDEQGNVTLVRAGRGCGHARIVTYALSSSFGQLVTALPDNRDIDLDVFVFDAGANYDVYYGQFGCSRRGQSDIHRITGIVTPTRVAADGRTTKGSPGEEAKQLPIPPGAMP